MKYPEIGFRGIYHNLWAIPMKETYKQAIKDYPGSDEANCILTYGYIEHDQTLKGIVLNAFSDAFVLETELFSLFEE